MMEESRSYNGSEADARMHVQDLDRLFRRRIGCPEDAVLTFDDLPLILERTGRTLPFENLRIIERRMLPITESNLIDKVLVSREGGLCYELNSLFCLFLQANGFDAVMARGIVYNHDQQAYTGTGRTHVNVLLRHEGQTYVIDTGFGGNLPLRPVPLSGESVSSASGEFRIRPAEGEHAAHGDYSFEMKQRYKDDDWRLGYTFDSRHPVGLAACGEIQGIIASHPDSGFNKRPLVTRLTERGSVTLTDTSLTITDEGRITKNTFEPEQFGELLTKHFD